MKRYMLFGFDAYYPRGGANDLLGCFDSVEGMDKFFMAEYLQEGYVRKFDYFQIYDADTNEALHYSLPDFESLTPQKDEMTDDSEYLLQSNLLLDAYLEGFIDIDMLKTKINELKSKFY